MRIVYILSGTNRLGGATKAFVNILKKVIDNGNQVLVVCPDENGIFKELQSMHNTNILPIALPYTYDILPFLRKTKDYLFFIPRLAKRIIKNRMATQKLIRICENFRPDLIHTNTSVNNIGYLTAKRLNIPHIWHIREYGKLDFNMVVPFQRKKLTSRNNYKVVITQDILKYKELENNESSKVIYDGVFEESILRYQPTSKSYFLYAGRVTNKKGAVDLIEAYRDYIRLCDPKNIHPLKFAGRADDDVLGIINRFCDEEGIATHIEILGERADIYDLMYEAKATIVPSKNEGFGFVLPEAMANGCLTIGRNTGGTKEQYDNGMKMLNKEIGFRYNTQKELVSILLEVSCHPKKYFEQMILNSQSVIRSLYTQKVSTDQLLDFYNKIIKNYD